MHKKIMRRITSLMLVFALVVTSVFTFGTVTVNAAQTTKTKDEAIAWVQANLGKTVGTGQCVALIKAYYEYLGAPTPYGDGKDYATNSKPSDWDRVQGGQPQKGDILVYGPSYTGKGAPEGHVAIYESDKVHYHQNFSGKYVERVTDYKYNKLNNPYWGYIRPNWTGKPYLTVTTGNSATATKISWTQGKDAKTYNLRIKKKDGSSYKTYKDVWSMTSTSYSLTLPAGNYSVYVDACNGSKYTASNTVTFTIQEGVAKPTLSVTAGDSATATKISWTKATNAKTYNLRIKKKDGSAYKAYKDEWGMTSTSYSLTLPAGEYSAYVDACNGSKYAASNTVNFTVKEATVGKATLSVTAGSSKTATKITWTKATNAKTYNLRIKKKDGSSYKTYKDEWGMTTRSYSVKLPAGDYSVYVDACNGSKYTASNTVKFTVSNTSFKVDEEDCSHDWDSGKITTQPTCTEKGVKTYTCQICGGQKTEAVNATNEHAYGNDYICDKCGYENEALKPTPTPTPDPDVVPEPDRYEVGEVKLSTATYVYNGKVKSPKVIVKDSEGNTISANDYVVTKPSGRKNVGKYTYLITFKDDYYGTEEVTLTIKPKATSVSKVTAAKKAVTVKWKKGSKSQVTGYEVRVATNSKFTKNKKTGTVTKYSTTSKKMTNLKAKTKYYVQVRAYKTVKVNGKSTKIYSDWSKYKTCRTK